jgi:S1-C subfamily serine protease
MQNKHFSSEHSQMIVETVRQVMPAVVSIVITKHLSKLEEAIGREFWRLGIIPPPEIEIPSDLVDARGMVRIGGGSGFFVREDGIILTNRHVIADPDAEYTVLWQDKRYPCQILARDPINDVAILKIQEKKVPVVTLGDSDQLELGESVIAIGNALGEFSNTVSAGIISGLSRYIFAFGDISEKGQELRGLIQTDAAINPGNSGGPLVNLRAEAVAINTAVVYGAQNIGFAIPINHAKRDLRDLEQYGRIRKPFLGIRYVILNENLKEKHHFPFSYGAYILREAGLGESGIVPHSPAQKAGLREGDIILECDGSRLTSEHTLQDILATKEVGDELSLKVWRHGKEFKVNITLAERK